MQDTNSPQDLEEEVDEHIAELKMKMEAACEADNEAVQNGLPAIQKVKLLPEVMALLNRQNVTHAVLDPESNFLQAVKFFLEPLSEDGSLPAYNIQRDIFTALTRMPVEKEALLSSGIGKVVLFYTKTKRAQPEIKRMAERLMGEWSRPILKRTDDYKKRFIDTKVVDTRYAASVCPHPPTYAAMLMTAPPANLRTPAHQANLPDNPSHTAPARNPPKPPPSPPNSPSAAPNSSSPFAPTLTARVPSVCQPLILSRLSATRLWAAIITGLSALVASRPSGA